MNTQRLTLRLLLQLLPLAFASTVMADDAEIYYSQTVSVNPNILFVLDNSGSMQQNTVPDSGGKTRMQVMQEVFDSVMASAPSNLNIGLMRYGGHGENAANGVSFPVKPVDLAKDGTGDAQTIISDRISPALDNLPDPASKQPVRTFLQDVANNWTAQGYTPIVDALYEAALYYRGDNVNWGRLQADQVRAAHPATYSGTLSYDPEGGGCDAPYECLKEYCYGKIVPDSCSIKSVPMCQWGETSPTGGCCAYEPNAYDEAGNATGWVCKDDNKTCPTYGCVTYEDKDKEVCKAQHCTGAVTGDAQYVSPMQYGCQANYIVLMSDGKPEYSGGTGVLPPSATPIQTLTGNSCADSPSGYKSGTCGSELTSFLATKDQNGSLDGDQFVNTFTVAFGVDDATATEYLASLANLSNGAMAARDAEGLKLAFERILQQVNTANPTVMASATPFYKLQVGKLPVPMLARQEQPQGLFRQTFGLLGDSIGNVEVRSLLLDVFNPLQQFRQLAATNGAFSANNLQELTDAFNSILDKIDASAASFSSPAYNVDKNVMLAHSDEVFLPVFERDLLPLWSGNLKKFKLKNGVIVGKDDQPAVDAQGVFTDTAWDLWSDTASGKDVKAGGAANKLPAPASRMLYTDAVGLNLSALNIGNTALKIGNLYVDNDGNNGHDNNPTGCDPDNPDADTHPACVTYRTNLINFVRGAGKDGQQRFHMGDVMNNKPLVMDYTSNGYVFVGTNEGFLHAIDSATGVEKWAFMPKDLLKNSAIFYDNTQAKQHVYGIDGSFTPWFRDKNANGKVDKADGDKFYLFFGMRRGGRAYYALDLSDIETPKVLWKMTQETTGFAELGESWSKPALARMRFAEGLKDVLVFGGGFDPALEEADPSKRADDSMGRDVFIVDAETGTLLWSLRQAVTGAADSLLNSIPGDIRVLDMDRNGALDRLYFADTGGKVWRVDMDMDVRDADSSLYDYNKAKLTVFANLAGSGTDKRKFYYEPDVALMQKDGHTVLTVALGSGYRSRPLNAAIQDRFYVMLDENVYQPPSDTRLPLTDTDLTEADTLALQGKTLQDGSSKGWYMALPNSGEKVLAPALTFLNKVVFTTFANDGAASTDPCKVSPNTARAYVLDLFDGQAVANLDRSLDDSKDKSVVAGVNEILGSAQILFRNPAASDGTSCTATDCRQTVEIRVGKMQAPLMDSGNSQNGSGNRAGSTDLSDILPRIFWRDDRISGN